MQISIPKRHCGGAAIGERGMRIPNPHEEEDNDEKERKINRSQMMLWIRTSDHVLIVFIHRE